MLESPPGILACTECSQLEKILVHFTSKLVPFKELLNRSRRLHAIETRLPIIYNHSFVLLGFCHHDRTIIPYFYFFCKLCIHISQFYIQKATKLILLLFSTLLYNVLLIHSVHSIVHFMIISTSTCFWLWSICY